MRLFVSGVCGAVVWAGCTAARDPTGVPSADRDADAAERNDGGVVDVEAPDPVVPPASITFHDDDLKAGSVRGTIVLGKATDEINVHEYQIFWGMGPGAVLSPIAILRKTGKDLSIPLVAAMPVSATHIIAFAANDRGDLSAGIALGPVDRAVSYVDISAGQPKGSGHMPSAVIDTTGKKLLVATSNAANGRRASLFRCELDGSGCSHTDISAGRPADSAWYPSAVIDEENQKLLVVTSDYGNKARPSLFRCNLDGTSCSYADLSAGQGDYCGYYPSAAVDKLNAKLLVVTTNAANYSQPGLFRCELDGTGCNHVDLSAGTALGSGQEPVVVLEPASAKLLAVTYNASPAHRPSLFRCEVDGTGCAYSDLSAGQGDGSGYMPAAALDSANGKLLVVTQNAMSSWRPSLFRCNLDGTACNHRDISAGQGSGRAPSITVDAVRGKLLVVAENLSNDQKPSLFGCNLDGTACSHSDLSAGQGSRSGVDPSAVLDATNETLRVVTDNDGKPALFSVDLR